MTKDIMYVNEKIDSTIRFKHYIPYRVDRSVRYKSNKMYYCDYWGQFFKVISARYDKYNILIDAYIRWDDGNYGLICTNLDIEDYLVEKDTTDLYKVNIINNKNSYTGAEIVYWFFMNNISQIDKKYSGFWKFVDRSSSLKILDNTRYFLTANVSPEGYYINCKVHRDKNPSRQ